MGSPFRPDYITVKAAAVFERSASETPIPDLMRAYMYV